MRLIFHFKVGFWLVFICGLAFFANWSRKRYGMFLTFAWTELKSWQLLTFKLCEGYRLREVYFKMKRRAGGQISLNNSFTGDVESGLSSRNFDIISQNDDDTRAGLDDTSKAEIKQIMEDENLSFDRARLLYMERKFGQNGIAPDGTPLDPKAFTFSK